MVRLLLILMALATSTACKALPIAPANNLPISPVIETTMNSKTAISIQSITLMAREERMAPEAVPPHLQPDVGFAVVFIRLENHREEDAALTVKSIEIRNADDGKLQPFSHPAQEIRLKPLERSEISFTLTNKTGYSGQGKVTVKAVVTYQIGDRIGVIESEPVEVKKHFIVGYTSPKMPR
jgi:hypothetical protein